MSIRPLVRFAFPLVVLVGACSAPRMESQSAPSAAFAQEDADALFRAQRWAEAVPLYERRTVSDPADGQAWYRLGYCLHALGRFDEAIAAHEKASLQPPTRAAGNYNLACALALLGRTDAAFEALDRGLAAGFRDARQLESDPDLARLRGDPRFASRAARLGIAMRDPAFDFWLGEWEVFDPSGTLVGRNVITAVERGFVIQENWTDAGGSTGRSLNFVDPGDGQWKQVWVDDHGRVTRYSGTWDGTSMVFVGSRVGIGGMPSPTRCTFSPAADGSVRQVIEDADGNGVFQVTFDGTYRHRKS